MKVIVSSMLFLVVGLAVIDVIHGTMLGSHLDETMTKDAVEEVTNDDDHYENCVSLFQYENDDCTGKAEMITFPTSTKPSSYCFPGPFWSVSEQHCNVETNTFEQKVWLGWSCGKSKLAKKLHIQPQEQVFTQDTCTYKVKVHYCIKGPCPKEEDDEEHDRPSNHDQEYDVEAGHTNEGASIAIAQKKNLRN